MVRIAAMNGRDTSLPRREKTPRVMIVSWTRAATLTTAKRNLNLTVM